MDVRGKVALITGGARGLGKAYARAILEAGGKVSLLDVLLIDGAATEKEFNEHFGQTSTKFIECDVTNGEQLDKAFRNTKDYFGRLDIVVNNAGIFKGEPEYNDLTIDINVKGVIKGTYLALDYLRKDHGGAGGIIVNIGSISGLWPFDSEYHAVYGASKYAVVGFTRCLALSIGEPSTAGHCVRIACLCPGPVQTDLLLGAMDADARFGKIVKDSGYCPESTVVAGFMKLLTDTNNHGGGLRVIADGTTYVFPEHLTKQEA